MTAFPVIVCRIAWMDYYRGVTSADVPRGGGAYVRAQGFGHEAFNFAPHSGRYFGFVQATGSGVNLPRLGCKQNAASLDGVTVVWVATHPTEGGTRVVGWYRNATVFSTYQDSPSQSRQLPNGNLAGFLATARDATLLGRDEREVEVPRGTAANSGMGQSNIWYPAEHDAAPLLKYIASFSTPTRPRPRRGAARLQDVERRQRIERVAMSTSANWFSDRGFDVSDVSMRQLGWDLEARRGRACLRIEVKGTSLDAASFAVDVTPNEYVNMRDVSHRSTYRLCIVTDCEGQPKLETFAWSAERAAWSTSDGGRELFIEEIVAARMRCAPD